MTTSIAFDGFVSLLNAQPFVGRALDAFGIAAETQFFVPPILVDKESEEGAQITLVSARGAAGKSRAARQLSTVLSVPLWCLDQDKAVSGTSLEYALGQYLGTHKVAEAVSLCDGPLVIIDSLDEARARVSGVSWSEFLQSLALLTNRGMRFVLLGRERTLEDAWAVIADQGTKVGWYEISHFGHAQSLDYVDHVVTQRDPTTVTHSHNYREARDAVIQSLAGSVKGKEADQFVGYAPVLDAVAALLIRKANFVNISHDFQDAADPSSRLGVLERILTGLLQRDQLKILPLAKDLDIADGEAYSPQEQLDWLCHHLEGSPAPQITYIADPTIQQKYVEKVSSFVNDHPFRSENHWASPVFEAYAAAKRFGTAFSNDRLVQVGHTSGLLFDFLAMHSSSLVLDEWQFAALHGSIMASEWGDASASVDLDEESRGAGEGTYLGSITVLRAGQPAHSTDFTVIPDEIGRLALHGPLSGLSVYVSGEISIPARSPSVVLGPDLYLHADRISLDNSTVEFARRLADGGRTSDGGNLVVLEALESISLASELSVPPGPGEFEVRVPADFTLTYPWVSYRASIDSSNDSPDDKAVRFLKMFMNLTRAHGHSGERSVFTKKLEGRQAVKGHAFKAAIGVLVQQGVARQMAEMVYMRSEWETYRFNGKQLPGQRQLEDVLEHWRPILDRISAVI